MMPRARPIVCVSCSVLRPELTALCEQGQLPFAVSFVDSMLHMEPERLCTVLSEVVDSHRRGEDRLVLVFGDCHARMNEVDSLAGVARVSGANCCEILLGSERYRQFEREGAFLILPEWAERWEEIFRDHLGFSDGAAKQFMAEMHSKLVYLDTGVMPEPTGRLEAFSRYVGLPCQRETVGLECLRRAIIEAVERLRANG